MNTVNTIEFKTINNFVEFAKNIFIPGQNIYDRTVYFLVGTELVTATSKWTKAQQNSTGGKGSVTRFRLNGKAISANDLDEMMNKIENVETIEYSTNVYQLKEIRTVRQNTPVVEIETPKVFAINGIVLCIINKISKISVMDEEGRVEKYNINKKSVEQLLNFYFNGPDRANAMFEIIKYLDDKNKTMLFM